MAYKTPGADNEFYDSLVAMFGGSEPYSEDGRTPEGDPLSDMQHLLDTWTERDPSTTAGQYYQDLKAVVNKYARN